MSIDFACTSEWIKLDVPHQIWEAQSADGGAGSVLWTRLLHNKVLFYASNYLRCYLAYLSPDFVNRVFSALGLIFFLVGIWYALTRKNLLVLGFALLAPLPPLFLYPKFSAVTGVYLGLIVLVQLYGFYQAARHLKRRFRK